MTWNLKQPQLKEILQSQTELKHSPSFKIPLAISTVFALQNGALDLPRGMSSSSPEFLQVASTIVIRLDVIFSGSPMDSRSGFWKAARTQPHPPDHNLLLLGRLSRPQNPSRGAGIHITLTFDRSELTSSRQRLVHCPERLSPALATAYHSSKASTRVGRVLAGAA